MNDEKDSAKIVRVSTKLTSATSELVQAAIMAAHTGNLADAVYVGSIGVGGALMPVAQLVAKKPDPDTINKEDENEVREIAAKLVTENTVLFAAILACKMSSGISKEGVIQVEFGPHIVLEAMLTFEKAMGYVPDPFLDPGMVKSARDAEKDTTVPFEEFLQKRKTSVPPSKTMQ